MTNTWTYIYCYSFILILRTQKMDSWWMLTNKLIMFVTSLLRIPNYSQGTMLLAFRRVDSFCEYLVIYSGYINFIISRSGIGRISHILNNWPSCLNLNLVRVPDKWIITKKILTDFHRKCKYLPQPMESAQYHEVSTWIDICSKLNPAVVLILLNNHELWSLAELCFT